uniref:EXPERA domain-containing protein n=1 Tax=Aegilops tauschii subsp. strangulata TaxID=200361 RepID=A0A453DZZ9_AEGTS
PDSSLLSPRTTPIAGQFGPKSESVKMEFLMRLRLSICCVCPGKEYSKGDSRYVARDTATVTVEGITAVLKGPASLLAVYAIASRKSYSHILQFAVCLGQLYGCIVYFTTAYLDGFNFWASPFYFWAYFIGANSSWIVIPLLIATRSWKKICAAVHQSEKVKTK